MKRAKAMLLLAGSLTMTMLTAQTKSEPDKGRFYATIFSEFNTTLEGEEQQTAFEVKRAYIGYFKELQDGFSAEVKLDIGSPDDVSSYSLLRRFGYFKTAALYYDYHNLKLAFGLIDALQFKVSESFWNKRYIIKSFMDEYKFGPSADIGFKAIYNLNKYSFDFAVYNGEGYSSLQNDNTFKAAMGVTAKPFNGFTTRIYGDYASKEITQSTLSVFAGQKLNRLLLGAEYNYQFNRDFLADYNLYGYSVFGQIDISKKFNILGRYDYITSNILDGSDIPWNLASNGSAVIAGLEYKASKQVRLSANYYTWIPEAVNSETESSLHINVEVKF
ncbi:porin [Geofilum sp. OHC36d9]|uniref:porin n=1 Tax=Geofilum sp. OHC36d9 TaxID=3458413 RepID=UPI0040338382